ncbi:hypothetical protein GGR57DRAFT_357914 [Xylariaceae sp. FL1272]|nr:hypothetical protein GGR57DRAFT_357914 [Xylariaceae sp. FL1272]
MSILSAVLLGLPHLKLLLPFSKSYTRIACYTILREWEYSSGLAIPFSISSVVACNKPIWNGRKRLGSWYMSRFLPCACDAPHYIHTLIRNVVVTTVCSIWSGARMTESRGALLRATAGFDNCGSSETKRLSILTPRSKYSHYLGTPRSCRKSLSPCFTEYSGRQRARAPQGAMRIDVSVDVLQARMCQS